MPEKKKNTKQPGALLHNITSLNSELKALQGRQHPKYLNVFHVNTSWEPRDAAALAAIAPQFFIVHSCRTIITTLCKEAFFLSGASADNQMRMYFIFSP